jgi:isopentenyldiphosphate isomerase
MQEKKIIIVNKKDKIIGYKPRNLITSSDIYRVSALWIQNSKGDILLAQRSLTKDKDPGKWGPAVAGTLEEDETYSSNIIKESEEEIGLINPNIKKVDYYLNQGTHKFFVQWFFSVVDKSINDFIIQESEVAQIKWFTKKELLEELRLRPNNFLDSLKWCINKFKK